MLLYPTVNMVRSSNQFQRWLLGGFQLGLFFYPNQLTSLSIVSCVVYAAYGKYLVIWSTSTGTIVKTIEMPAANVTGQTAGTSGDMRKRHCPAVRRSSRQKNPSGKRTADPAQTPGRPGCRPDVDLRLFLRLCQDQWKLQDLISWHFIRSNKCLFSLHFSHSNRSSELAPAELVL